MSLFVSLANEFFNMLEKNRKRYGVNVHVAAGTGCVMLCAHFLQMLLQMLQQWMLMQMLTKQHRVLRTARAHCSG